MLALHVETWAGTSSEQLIDPTESPVLIRPSMIIVLDNRCSILCPPVRYIQHFSTQDRGNFVRRPIPPPLVSALECGLKCLSRSRKQKLPSRAYQPRGSHKKVDFFSKGRRL